MSAVQHVSTFNILGIEIARLDQEQAIGQIEDQLKANAFTRIAFVNANNANVACKSDDLRNALKHALVLPDGVGIDMAAKILYGQKFPHNLNGTDFVPKFFKQLSQKSKVGLIGAMPNIAEKACDAFASSGTIHDFKVFSDGYFPVEKTSEILSRLAGDRPDILIVAMGTPNQELWVERNITNAHCTIVISAGALFDFMAGAVPRAPLWLRKLRLEWVFRLLLEPMRMWRRYLIGNPLFLYRVMRQRLTNRLPTKRPQDA